MSPTSTPVMSPQAPYSFLYKYINQVTGLYPSLSKCSVLSHSLNSKNLTCILPLLQSATNFHIHVKHSINQSYPLFSHLFLNQQAFRPFLTCIHLSMICQKTKDGSAHPLPGIKPPCPFQILFIAILYFIQNSAKYFSNKLILL